MEAYPLDYEIYETEDGFAPYEEWLSDLDPDTQGRIMYRIDKLYEGILGTHKPITDSKGIIELIEDFGPGYRIYCRKIGKYKYLILCGGKKKTQKKDITRAKVYWAEYQKRK
ncbi:MAG: type II toxin-antitoxin system RelE/ParE family toxin [Thermoleophilia bacterium]